MLAGYVCIELKENIIKTIDVHSVYLSGGVHIVEIVLVVYLEETQT